MSSPLAIYKLIVLYLLDRVGGEIAMDRPLVLHWFALLCSRCSGFR